MVNREKSDRLVTIIPLLNGKHYTETNHKFLNTLIARFEGTTDYPFNEVSSPIRQPDQRQ